MFQIVKVNGRLVEPILDGEGKLRVFETSAEATQAAKTYSELLGVKVQPRPISDDAWRQREQTRFGSGEYELLPSWFPHKPEHFAHLSTRKDGMVSFTEDALKGAADRQTRIKPGVYIARYFGDYATDTVTWLAQRFAAQFEDVEFKLAMTEEDIERIYRIGPRSCMSERASSYASPVHPVRVYAAGDLAVAYIESAARHISARAIVWPEKKQHSRIYGDDRLRAALARAGYQSGNLQGARLLKIPFEDSAGEGCYTAPYIDGYAVARVEGDFLVIDPDGYIMCGSTEGRGQDHGKDCEHCHKRVYSGAVMMVQTSANSQSWCQGCVTSHAWRCDHTRQHWTNEVTPIECAGGERCASTTFSSYGGFQCAGNGRFYAGGVIRLNDGTTWSRRWFQEHGFRCAISGRYFRDEDMSEKYPGISRECEDLAGRQDTYYGTIVEARL